VREFPRRLWFKIVIMMKYAKLGDSSITISRIGLGCMSLKPGNTDNERIIHHAIGSGINYFDTADIYDNGLNEKMLGNALSGKRDKVFIASKVGNKLRHDGKGLDWDPSKAHIVSSVEKSLKRLGTDHLDLYQLHGGTIADPIDEAIETFENLKEQGKILQYGISSIRPNVIKEWVSKSNIVSVMMQYSLLDRRPEEECMELLRSKGISVLVRGAVAQGLLIDKASKEYLERSVNEVKAARDIVQQYSNNTRTAAQTALQFALQNPAVTSTVVGIRTIEQLQETIAVFDVPWLSETELEDMRSSVAVFHYTEHRN
jgi:aryl-alcohol dehydrogenase-like predicted oxidoreductase